MSMSEFKMWLEGFEEAIDGAPTKAQWKKIKVKLSEVMSDSYPVYPAPHYPTWPYTPVIPRVPHFVFTSPSTGAPPPFRGGTTWSSNATETVM